MRKIFAAAILLTALLIGNVSAEKIPEPAADDPEGATAAPAAINHPDSIYYTHIDCSSLTSTDDRIILTDYPTYQQTTGYSCGPAAALTVLYRYGNRDFDEATLINRMNTKPHIGTSLSNMIKFFRDIGWDVQSSLDTPPIEDEEAFCEFVKRKLIQGKPIIVDNIEWGGHWRVIIGLDTMGTGNLYDDVLIFADPFDTSDHNQDGYTVGSLDRFFSMWFAHDLLPKSEHYQPWLVATPRRA